MVTRSQASGAGGLRPVGGSGQTDTRVSKRNPSKTRVVIFSLRGGFLPRPIQQSSMAQRDNRHSWYLACTPAQPALAPLSDAANYPAGARPSKCIIIIIRFERNSGEEETVDPASLVHGNLP
jgi:hypothetical protein